MSLRMVYDGEHFGADDDTQMAPNGGPEDSDDEDLYYNDLYADLGVQCIVIVLYHPHHPCTTLTISSCLYYYIFAYSRLPIALKINRPLLNSVVQLPQLRMSTARYETD